MKELNWYTGTLFTIGIYALFVVITDFRPNSYIEFALILALSRKY